MNETHQDLFLFGKVDEGDWRHWIKYCRRGRQRMEELGQRIVKSRLMLRNGSNVVPRAEAIGGSEV